MKNSSVKELAACFWEAVAVAPAPKHAAKQQEDTPRASPGLYFTDCPARAAGSKLTLTAVIVGALYKPPWVPTYQTEPETQ